MQHPRALSLMGDFADIISRDSNPDDAFDGDSSESEDDDARDEVSPMDATNAYSPALNGLQAQKKRRNETLQRIPFVVPFVIRVRIFHAWVRSDARRASRGSSHPILSPDLPSARVTVRRDHVFRDGFSALYERTSAQLKRRIAITFVNDMGMEEAGIDGGGVYKEFLTSLSRVAFDPNYGLFCVTQENTLYPNPSLNAAAATVAAAGSGGEAGVAEVLQYFFFLGRILGKALYDGILALLSDATAFNLLFFIHPHAISPSLCVSLSPSVCVCVSPARSNAISHQASSWKLDLPAFS